MALTEYRKAEYKRINTSPSTIKRLYTIKNIYYGAYIESTEYFKIKATFNSTRLDFGKNAKGSKREYSVTRAKDRLYKLVEANIGRHGKYQPIFFTLTSRDQCTEYKQSNRKIKEHIRRLNRYTNSKIKYLAVPELHKSGAIHYHGVFFNLPFIDIQYYHNYLWGYGHVDLQVSRDIKSMGAYMAKYLTKDFQVNTPLHTKTYFTSRGLLSPTEEFTVQEPQGTLYELETFINTSFVKIKYATNISIRKKYNRYKSYNRQTI